MWKKLIASLMVIGFFSGCVYTDSALQYAKEGTTDTSNTSTNVSDTNTVTNTTSVPDVAIDMTAGTTSIIK